MEIYFTVKILPRHVIEVGARKVSRQVRRETSSIKGENKIPKKLGILKNALSYVDAARWAKKQVPFNNHQRIAERIVKSPLSVPFTVIDTGKVWKRKTPSAKLQVGKVERSGLETEPFYLDWLKKLREKELVRQFRNVDD